jgi:ATP-dependent exoDNAse (exonuclease V) beta subunit
VVEFTPEQQDAIHYRGQDACVVAGPGSGKTTVLVERYRRLIEERGFDPSEILAITFTEKAAANMRAKIAEKFRHHPVRLRDLEGAWIHTIHGFCARLLKENAIAAGIDPRFRVLDARESDDLQVECLNGALDELTAQRRDEMLALIEALHVTRIAPDLKSVYDGIRSAGISIEQVRAMPTPLGRAKTAAELASQIEANVRAWPFKLTPTQVEHRPEVLEFARELAGADSLPFEQLQRLLVKPPIHLGRIPRDAKEELRTIREQDLEQLLRQAVDRHTAPYRAMIFDVLARFEALYNERKRKIGALDFNDLERRSIQLLRENEAVRLKIRGHFRQIMLDEFQDINEQQNVLIDLVRGEDVFFAVGDINQSIYGFRHARPEIFREYQQEIEDHRKHSGSLFNNFRSRREILGFVESLLNSAQGIEKRSLTAAREFAEAAHTPVEIVRVMDDEEEGDDDEGESTREARWIAHRIAELRRPFRDFAILCRNGESMKPILHELGLAGIPYVCGRRKSFLSSREGLDIAALLNVIANPRDGVALGTVLRSRLVGVSDEALLRARMLGSSLTSGLNVAAYDPAKLAEFAPDDAEKLGRFLDNLKRWRAALQTTPLDVMIARMLTDCGFAWNDNVEAFLQLARTRGAGRTLLEFLYELDSIEKGLSTESDLSDEEQGNCVQVMTAHAAKGLEFPVTILASLHQGTRRGSASVSFTPEYGLGMKWRDRSKERPGPHDSLKDSWSQANAELVKAREDEEANRLFYVAMTRAEDHLILTYTKGKRPPANWARMVEDRVTVVVDSDPPRPERAGDAESILQIEAISRPAAAERDETSVNVTSLAVFASCPRKYFLQRYIGWSGAPSAWTEDEEDALQNEAELQNEANSELSAADLGSAVHAALAGKPGPHPVEARELAQVFLQNELGRRAARAERVAREWEFVVELEGVILRGSIDLWFEDEDGIHIVDYKTDSAVRPAEYAPQLALYALALERALGKRPASASLHFLRHDVVAEIPLDDAAFADARGLIARLRAAQNALTFDLNEGAHCRVCSYFRSQCPAEG